MIAALTIMCALVIGLIVIVVMRDKRFTQIIDELRAENRQLRINNRRDALPDTNAPRAAKTRR